VGCTLAKRGVGRGIQLLDDVDEGEAALADLTQDAEAALVDPDIATALRCVVEGVEARHGATHLRAPSSPPANSDAARFLNLGFVWFGSGPSHYPGAGQRLFKPEVEVLFYKKKRNTRDICQ
jgi:hypothetical protein